MHGSRGRFKAWLITFNFDRFRDPPGLVIFFAQNVPMGSNRTYNASRVLRTIWIASECHQTFHLLFCRTPTKWHQNGRKSCSCFRSKTWETLIYHPMSPRGIPWQSVHGSRGRQKAWLIAFNFDRFRALPARSYFSPKTFLWSATRLIMHTECLAQSEYPPNATKRPIYYFVVQPQNDPKTNVKAVLIPVQSRGRP